MAFKDMKFAFLGAGNIAKAIIGGFVGEGLVPADNIFVFDTDKNKYSIDIMRSVNCMDSLSDAVSPADVVVFALKPSVIGPVASSLANDVKDFKNKVYISVAAAVSSDYICRKMGANVPIIRTMPNTPLLLGEGAVAVSKNDAVSDKVFSYVCRLFSGIARIEVIDEELMNGVIAVNGSSPAYVYKFFKAMTDGALAQGISKEKSVPLILQSIKGAICMIERSGKDIDTLIKDVSSPGGTTIAALNALDNYSFEDALVSAMTACTKRADEMAKEIERQ